MILNYSDWVYLGMYRDCRVWGCYSGFGVLRKKALGGFRVQDPGERHGMLVNTLNPKPAHPKP